MTDVIGQVYQKIPVIVMDRGVEALITRCLSARITN